MGWLRRKRLAERAFLLRHIEIKAALALRFPPLAPDAPASAVWDVLGDVGRRYAAVSGDMDPMHLSRWAAKALGFPRVLVQGMPSGQRREPAIICAESSGRRVRCTQAFRGAEQVCVLAS